VSTDARSPGIGRMWPTLTACAAVLVVFGAVTHALTGGFEHWTFESLRVARAADGNMHVPATPVRTSIGGLRVLWQYGDTSSAVPITIVDFIYTACPTVCQALGSEYQRMQSQLRSEPEAGVRLLSISFDPARDSVEALAAYGQRFAADDAFWDLAAPTNDAALQTLLRRLGVVAVPDGSGGFVHNASLHLIDGDGRLRAIHDTADWAGALNHARRLAQGAVR
jgi:protein SCO1